MPAIDADAALPGTTGTTATTATTEVDRTVVAIIEDHKMVAEGLAMGLAASPDLSVAGVAASLAEGRILVQTTRPDVVLLDQRLPDGDGVSFAAELTAKPDGPAIVMVTSIAGLIRRD